MILRTALPMLLVLLACSAPTEGPPLDESGNLVAGPDENGRVVGAIEFYHDPVRVEAPAAAENGEAFRVTVATYGGGCVSKGETEVDVDGLTAVITPYDYDVTRKLPPNGACIDILHVYEHEAMVRFDRPGTATVVVRGQRKPSGEVFTVTRTVEVR